MEPLEWMVVISVVSNIINTMMTAGQQEKEFDQQQQLLRQQQQFTREREDLAFQRSRPVSQMQGFLDAGFNPSLAAQSILGGDGLTTQASGSPSAPTVNSAIQALQSMMSQGGQNLYDAYMKDIQAKNIQANTEKTEVETGLLPRDYELRAMSTEAQIGVWNASVEKIAKENELTDEQIELAKQQNLYYGRMAEADLNLKEKEADKLVADAKLANEKAKTESHVRNELDARAALEGEQVNTERAKQAELYAQANLEEVQAVAVSTEQQIRAVDLEWVQKYDVPLTVDAQKYLAGLLDKGEYDKASTWLHSIFESARNQELGKNYGSKREWKLGGFSIPEGRYESPFFNSFSGRSTYQPFWNPQQ